MNYVILLFGNIFSMYHLIFYAHTMKIALKASNKSIKDGKAYRNGWAGSLSRSLGGDL